MEPANLPAITQPSGPVGVHSDMNAVAALEHDVELMLRVRDGDSTSFGCLLERHRGSVIQFLYRMVQDRAVAEELGQEVFLRVYRSRATYEPTAKFTTWLFRIATHLALNWIRDNKTARGQESLDRADGPAKSVFDRQPTIEQQLVFESKMQEIRRAIGMLPANQRAAVLMHKYQEMDYSQIASALNCSESAVKSLLFRAYERLRSRLAHFSGMAVR